MASPKQVVKINKKGVRYVSSVDKAQFTIRQLSRAALINVAKVMIYKMKEEAGKSPSLHGLERIGKKGGKKGRFQTIFQYWVRGRECDLQIGIKANTWYGVESELGSNNQPRRAILQNTVFNNIDLIRKIEGEYLSAINDENLELGLIDEQEHSSANDKEVTVDSWERG